MKIDGDEMDGVDKVDPILKRLTWCFLLILVGIAIGYYWAVNAYGVLP